jgi:hypothetical protein
MASCSISSFRLPSSSLLFSFDELISLTFAIIFDIGRMANFEKKYEAVIESQTLKRILQNKIVRNSSKFSARELSYAST